MVYFYHKTTLEVLTFFIDTFFFTPSPGRCSPGSAFTIVCYVIYLFLPHQPSWDYHVSIHLCWKLTLNSQRLSFFLSWVGGEGEEVGRVHLSSIHLVYSVHLFLYWQFLFCAGFLCTGCGIGWYPFWKLKTSQLLKSFIFFNIIKYSHVWIRFCFKGIRLFKNLGAPGLTQCTVQVCLHNSLSASGLWWKLFRFSA